MLGASGFLAHIFNNFLKWDISIDVIATSEVSVSLTVNTNQNLEPLIADLQNVADVELKTKKAIVTIICDVKRSSSILSACFKALQDNAINVQMISQGASKVNVSMLVEETEVNEVVQVLHKSFIDNKLIY